MVLNQEQFDAFRMEIATFGNIPILSQYCGIGCVFCKVHTDSYLGHYPKIPPIDREDLLKGFEYINPNVKYCPSWSRRFGRSTYRPISTSEDL